MAMKISLKFRNTDPPPPPYSGNIPKKTDNFLVLPQKRMVTPTLSFTALNSNWTSFQTPPEKGLKSCVPSEVHLIILKTGSN